MPLLSSSLLQYHKFIIPECLGEIGRSHEGMRMLVALVSGEAGCADDDDDDGRRYATVSARIYIFAGSDCRMPCMSPLPYMPVIWVLGA